MSKICPVYYKTCGPAMKRSLEETFLHMNLMEKCPEHMDAYVELEATQSELRLKMLADAYHRGEMDGKPDFHSIQFGISPVYSQYVMTVEYET